MADESKQLFKKAWQIAAAVCELPVAERASEIQQACAGDAALCSKVEELLLMSTAAAPLTHDVHEIVSEALEVAARDLIDDVEPGDQVGSYRVIKELGAGGMSRVYLAVREGVEFDQQVAVKLMRAFSTSRSESHARFEREQQVLASLSHPNIANIIDGGVTPSNRPFLVMEFVDGHVITEHCRSHALDLDARLELFIDVCAAVEHAHRRLIVHRDLKPSNIMVDKSGQVKLLDFGIAKLLDEENNANLTRTGLMMLTPQYAAPEQVTGLPITTSTDVYALGLLLYELMTDTPAWDAEGLSVSEQLRHICDKQPTSPSVVRPAMTWSARLRGDLDLIVAKALAKTPTERYPTSTELVRDIRLWQSGEPVSAHAPTALYRLRKFSRRHWVGLSISLVFVGVVGSFMVALLQQQDSIRLERDRAQDAQAATGAINRFLTDELLSATSSQAAYGRDVPVSLILERAEETAGRAFDDQPVLEAYVRETLSRTFLRLGDLDRAADNLAVGQSRLMEGAPTTVSGSHRFKVIEIELQIAQGDADGARAAAADQLLDLANQPSSELESNRFDYIATLVVLARAQKELDEWPQAQKNLSTALEALEKNFPRLWRLRSEAQLDLAQVVFAQRETAYALDVLEQRLALQTRYLGENHPDILSTLRWKSRALYQAQRRDEAMQVGERAYTLANRVYGEQHPEVGYAASALAAIYIRFQRYDEAVALFEEALAASGSQFGDSHPETLKAMQNLGVGLSYAGELEQAEEVKREAYLGYKELFGERSSKTIRVLKNLSSTLAEQGKSSEHRKVIEQLVNVSKSFEMDADADPIQLNDAASLLLTCEPADLREPVVALSIARLAVARTARQKGEPLITLGNALEANGYVKEAIETYEEAARNPGVVHIHALPRSLAALYQKTNQIKRAEDFFAEHLERRRTVRDHDDWLLGMTWHELARFYVHAGLAQKAVPVLEKAMAQYRLTHDENDPLIMRSTAVLGAAQSQLGDVKTGEQNMLTAYHALKANRQVTSDIKREIISWLIEHYATLAQSAEHKTWETELDARLQEPLFSDWTR